MSCGCPPSCEPVCFTSPPNFGLEFPSLVGPMGPPGGAGTYVENYAALRLIDPTTFTAGYVAWVSGYATINDGGQGNFQYDPTSVAADNDGTIIEPANGVGGWKRIYSGDIFLAWFGIKIGDVVANGLFNDAACLAAVNIAKVLGTTIVAPAGTIVISTHFPIRNPTVPPVSLLDYNGITVIGQGRSTIFKQENVAGNSADVFNLNGVKNVNLLNFTITSEINTGVSVSGTNAVSIINGGENILCHRIHAYRMPYIIVGAGFDGGSAFTIQHGSNALNDRNIQFINCSGEGNALAQCGSYALSVVLSGASQITNPPQGVIVQGCKFREMYQGVFLELVVATNISVAPKMQVQVTNNQFVDMQQGFVMYGMTGVTFTENQFASSFVGAAGFNPASTLKFGMFLLSNFNCVVTDNTMQFAESDFFATIGGGATGDAATPTTQSTFTGNAFLGVTSAAYGILGSTTEAYGYTTKSYFANNTFDGAPVTGDMDPSFYRADLANVVIDEDGSKIPSLRGLNAIVGPEGVTNGTAWTGAAGATPPTGWTVALAAVYSIVAGELQIAINATPQNPGGTTFSVPTVAGRRYVVTFTFHTATAAAGVLYIGSSAGAFDLYLSANLTNTVAQVRRVVFTATSAVSAITLLTASAVAGEATLWDNVSMTEIPLAADGPILGTGTIRSNGDGIGYATGAGGTVTQITSKATAVVLSKVTGTITMDAANIAAATIVSFVFTNTFIELGDMLVLNHVSGGTMGSYTFNARCIAGSATIDVRNNTAGGLAEAIVLQFGLLKGVRA